MALNCFEKAIKINPDSEDGYFYLGTYYFQANDYNTAKKYFKKSLEINYNQSETHLNLGSCYFVEKLYKNAIDEFQISIDIDNNINAIYNMGLSQFLMQNYRSSLNIF